ncbi:MAG TPA: signal peptidase II [Anaerolineales bacterium]|nr:signal peptidase II [Anaerolineales bacterium]
MDTPQPAMQAKRFTFGAVLTFIRKSWRDYLFLFLLAGVIIALDQWTKYLVRTNIPLAGDWLPSWLAWLAPYARIRYWYNSGAAFGIFQEGNLIFSILAVIVACLIVYYFPRVSREDWWLRLAMSMQLAGALGNLIDRIMFKHVTDFISVGNFAVFNVADSSISVGVAILVLGVWIKENADKKKAAAAKAAEAEPVAPKGDEAKGE